MKVVLMSVFLLAAEGVVTGQSKEERAITCQRVGVMMKESGFPWCIAALEEVQMKSIQTAAEGMI